MSITVILLEEKVVAGPEGIEPSSRVLETPILPLNYGPKISFHIKKQVVIVYHSSGGNRALSANKLQKGGLGSPPIVNLKIVR